MERATPGSVGAVGEDMRDDQVRARRGALAFLWVFLSLPGVFGIMGVINSGFTSLIGWLVSSVYVLATIILAVAFVNARRMPVAPRNGGRRLGRYEY